MESVTSAMVAALAGLLGHHVVDLEALDRGESLQCSPEDLGLVGMQVHAHVRGSAREHQGLAQMADGALHDRPVEILSPKEGFGAEAEALIGRRQAHAGPTPGPPATKAPGCPPAAPTNSSYAAGKVNDSSRMASPARCSFSGSSIPSRK